MPVARQPADDLRKQPLRRAEGDRIVILEDSKGTGKADKSSIFADGFNHILDGVGAGVLEPPPQPIATIRIMDPIKMPAILAMAINLFK